MRKFICSSQLAKELLRLMEILKTDGAGRLRLASDGSARTGSGRYAPTKRGVRFPRMASTASWKSFVLALSTKLIASKFSWP